MDEFEILGPETRVLAVDHWGISEEGRWPADLLLEPNSWEQVEEHIKNLENKSLELIYQNRNLEINGHRTPNSFVPQAKVDPILFTSNTFLLFGNSEPEHPDAYGLYPAEGRASLEDTLRIAKTFYETGILEDSLVWNSYKEMK